jgi:uncharacterized SAM-binding protein YcdF (DUF218 family)
VSEWLWILLQPSSVLVMLVVLALCAAWIGWRAVAATLLTVFLLVVGSVMLLPFDHWLGAPLEAMVSAPPLPDRIDGIVVLGGAVEWRVSGERGQLALNAAAERVAAGAALAQRYPGVPLILTGSFADAFARDFRVNPMQDSLFFGPHFGDRPILYLGQARSTYEDALYALQAADPAPGEVWLLVTSAWHMPRALGTFANLGWRLTPYPVDYRTSDRFRFEPRFDVAQALADLDRLVREWGALEVYRQTGRLPASP